MDLTVSPARLGCLAVGVVILVLLYRRVTVLGRLTVCSGWVSWASSPGSVIEGLLHFDAARAFDFGEASARTSVDGRSAKR